MSKHDLTRRDILGFLGVGVLGTLALNAGILPYTTRTAAAFGEDDTVRLAVLKHTASNWHPYPHALTTLLNEVTLTTSITTADQEETIGLTDDLTPFPLLFVCGNGEFSPWSDDARKNLRRYIGAGGMLVFDSSDATADGGFKKSVERELQHILPDKKFSQTPQTHVLYKSFYLCNGNEGRTDVRGYTDTIIDENRIQVLYIYNDLLGAYDRRAVANPNPYAHSNRGRTQEFAYRLGVNLVMYALTLDYKEDQVHVPFILRRRRWTVP